MHVCARLGTTRSHDGVDDGGVDSLLRAMSQGQLARDNVDAAAIGDQSIDVHVSQANVLERVAWWSTRSRHAHVRGATISGRRSRRSSKTPENGDGTVGRLRKRSLWHGVFA